MPLYQLTIHRRRGVSRDKVEDLATEYLISLERTGQVWDGQWVYSWRGDKLIFYVDAARTDSIDARFNSIYGNRRLESLAKVIEGSPEWLLIDDQAPKRYPRLETAPFLYLASRANNIRSALRRGDTGERVPMYLIPIHDEEKEYVLFWARDAERFDQIFLSSETLEMPAYRQTADPFTKHAKWGRELCARIEKATGIPTFYFLERYYGFVEGEEDRPCPGCGAPWRVKRPKSAKPARKPQVWSEIHFKCDPCRLVSVNAACAYPEDASKAQIGAWRPDRRRGKPDSRAR